MTITVATANLGNGKEPRLNVDHQTDYLHKLALRVDPDVVLIQEALPGLAEPPGFLLLRPPQGAHHDPILIRAEHSKRIHGIGADWIHAGKEGAWAPKWLTWVTLDGIGSFANVHLIASFDDKGRPREPNSSRWVLAQHHIGRLRHWAVQAGRRTWDNTPGVVVGGDFNVDLQDDNRVRFGAFPAVQLALAGLDDAPIRVGTHPGPKGRTIDRIFHNEALVPTGAATVLRSPWPFDHDNPVVEFRKPIR